VIPPGVHVGYNDDWGFTDGAQDNIFEPGPGAQNSTLNVITTALNVTSDEVSGAKNPTYNRTSVLALDGSHEATPTEGGCKAAPSSA